MKFLFSQRRLILFVAAIGNLLGGIVAVVSPSFFFHYFFLYPPDRATTFAYLPMYHHLFWGFVIIMGIAYWITAINPDKNRAVIFAGAMGKLLAAGFWAMLMAQHQGKWLMAASAGWDGLLGLLLLGLLFTPSSAEKK